MKKVYPILVQTLLYLNRIEKGRFFRLFLVFIRQFKALDQPITVLLDKDKNIMMVNLTKQTAEENFRCFRRHIMVFYSENNGVDR